MRFKYYAARLGVVFVSVYIALFLAEIVLWRMEPKHSLYEMYTDMYAIKGGRVVLKPGYYKRVDESDRQVETRINSYGYRGQEPSPNPKSRVLLLGDSFAFGALLDQKETIGARIEEKETGLEVDNLGVNGYNLPEQLVPLREWTLPANQVVYLFYLNDFEVPRQLTDVKEMGAVGEGMAGLGTETHAFKLLSSIRLPRLRRVVTNTYMRFRNRHSSAPVNWWPHEKDQKVLVPRSLKYTLEMRDVAAGRNMGFQVAIAPSLEEVRDGRHHPLVAEYISGLRTAGVPVLDLLLKFSTNDYWSYDAHFNPKGAQVAADEIYKALKERNFQIQ